MDTNQGYLDRRRMLAVSGGAVGAMLAGRLTIGDTARAAQAMGRDLAERQMATTNWTAVANAVGGPGEMKEDNVFLIDLARNDIKASLNGVQIQPDLALDSEMAFKDMGSSTMVMGEICVLQSEATPVNDRLNSRGFDVSALHNHLFGLQPLPLFIHFSRIGDAMTLARDLHYVLEATKTPFTTSSPKRMPAIDVTAIEHVFGRSGEVHDQVFQVTISRRDTISMRGMMIPPAMGVEANLYFQAAGGGQAASTAELPLTASEVVPVSRALRAHGIQIMALHNHMIDETPRIFFLHTWAVGSTLLIARGLRAALAHANMQLS